MQWLICGHESYRKMIAKVQKNSKKGFVMENAHTISALCAKIAHIQGEIELHYKAIKWFEIKANTLKHR